MDHRQVSGPMFWPNCQTEINPGGRAFYCPGDKALYGDRCGHGEKAERDFNAYRIDEDGY